jgi:methyl-accepting chemotaxis protein
MSQAAKDNANSATQVSQSASDLSRIAGDLKETVAHFRI